MKYRVAIIEDEKYAAQFVAGLLEDNAPDMQIVGVLESVEEATKQLPTLAPDLVLADIHLEDGLSFKIFETLQWKKPVIFITAYDAYAIRAFKVNGIDYLLKPVDEEALLMALQKFRDTSFSGNFGELFSRLQNRASESYKERFAITIGTRLISVPVQDIAYFFYQNKNIILVCHNGQKYPYAESLDQVSSVLDPVKFFRINRNYIIAHAAINKIEVYAGRNMIVSLQPEAPEGTLQVSKDRITEFKYWLDK
jgi:DNA-binding LytR/AlgR family response regulator